MRKTVIYCGIILFILALSPVLAIFFADGNNTDNKVTSLPETEELDSYNQVISITLTMIDEDFCDEGILAALAIADNNVKFLEENKIVPDTFSEKNKNAKLEQKIKELYKKTDIQISFNNKRVYIPAVKLSKGYTETTEEYSYIRSVASPWDCFDESYVYNKDYPAGVSMKGIDYLCKDGMNFEEALKWYLPDFEIK